MVDQLIKQKRFNQMMEYRQFKEPELFHEENKEAITAFKLKESMNTHVTEKMLLDPENQNKANKDRYDKIVEESILTKSTLALIPPHEDRKRIRISLGLKD